MPLPVIRSRLPRSLRRSTFDATKVSALSALPQFSAALRARSALELFALTMDGISRACCRCWRPCAAASPLYTWAMEMRP